MRLRWSVVVVTAVAAVGVRAQMPTTTSVPAAGGPIVITALGHASVQIEQGAKVVIVDPVSAQTDLSRAKRADLILVTDIHPDHFDPAAVARYLKHNFRAELVSSEQVVEQVAEALNDEVILRNRVHAVVGSSPESSASLTVGGIGLHIRRISHGSGRHAEIQNLAQVVTLGGWKILHIGDSDAGEAEFKRLDFKKEKLDVAFIPFWYLTDDKGVTLVKRYVRPRIVVAMHIPPGELEQRTAEIRARFPDAVIFTQPFETKTFQ